MKVKMKAATASAMLILALSGCEGPGDDNASSNSASSSKENSDMEFDEIPELSNPVDVLSQIEGCELEPGVETGSQDVDGNLYADCNFTNGATVTVRVVGPQPDGYGNEDQTIDDTHKVIYGQDWYAAITADPSLFVSEIDVNAIASQTGGTVAE
jgi:hypothetical protein